MQLLDVECGRWMDVACCIPSPDHHHVPVAHTPTQQIHLFPCNPPFGIVLLLVLFRDFNHITGIYRNQYLRSDRKVI